MPLTGEVITKFCKDNSLEHTIDLLPHGANIHWIGPRRKSGKVLLFFHGGGYNGAARVGHVAFGRRCADNASSILVMLEYTLAPEKQYPTQLDQAIMALRFVLASTAPSKVTILGDSAGAHLAIGVLSEIMHPSDRRELVQLKEKLGGLCLVSPFLSFNYEKDSYTTNASRDFVSLAATKRFNRNFKPIGLSDEEAVKIPALSPLDAPDGWYRNCPVERIMLTMGAWEVFLDDQIAFGYRLRNEAEATKTKIDIVQGSKEVHSAPFVDGGFGVEGGDTQTAVLAWMSNTSM